MSNLLVVNVDSVNYDTYCLLPPEVRQPWELHSLENAYAVSNSGIVLSTISFFMHVFGGNPPEFEDYRTGCWMKPSRRDLLSALSRRNYKLAFGSEWPYAATETDHKRKSVFNEWCAKRFDYYIDTNPRREAYDAQRLFDAVGAALPKDEPWCAMMQIHDTHLPFHSVGVKDWFPWKDTLARLFGYPAITPQQKEEAFYFLNAHFGAGRTWAELPECAAIMELFRKVRGLQLSALEYTLDACGGFLNEHPDVIFHLIGDHPVILGERNIFGNPSGPFNWTNSKDLLRTMWLTNQTLPSAEEYKVADFISLTGWDELE